MPRHPHDLSIRPVPAPVNAKHPPPPRGGDVLMEHEFTLGFIAPKGSGKTTAICNLLDFYRGYFHAITVFSPTLESDEKWDWVKRQALLSENKALKRFLAKHDKTLEEIVGGPNPCVTDTPFDPRIPDHQYLTEYDESVLEDMLTEQDKLIARIKSMGGTKHLAHRWLLIFDDLVGSTLFNNRRDNVFKVLNTRHRHFNASIIMVSQGYKEIPKTVRTNWTALILFAIANDAEVKVIYEEFAMGLKLDVWLQVYAYCTEQDYGFMYLNTKKKEKRLRIMKNFDQYVFVDAHS
jgi:Poxvirus A32 protein.